MNIWRKISGILVVIFGLMAIVGCGDSYDETDITAATTWELMTIREKSMYDRVQKQWGQNKLGPIREELRKRKLKPDEDAIPFSDIFTILKTINEVKMVVEDQSKDYQDNYRAAKWDKLFSEWYYVYVDPQGGNFNKKAPATTTGFVQKEEVVKEIDKKSETTKPSSYKSKSVDTYTIDDLISEREYSKIKKLIRDCDGARQLLDSIVSLGRPLTKSDRDAIKERYLYCKTLSLTEE